MDYITTFLDKHEYILPALCIIIIALLIAIIVCLILLNQKAKDEFDKTETDLRSRLRNNFKNYEHIIAQASALQEKLNDKTKECSSLKKQISDLQKELNIKTQDYVLLEESYQSEKQKKTEWLAQFTKEQDELLTQIEKDFYSSTTKLICTRNFLNSHESSIHYYLEEELKDNAYSDKYGSHLYLFVQVALNSLFDLTEISKDLSDQVKNKGKGYVSKFYRSKSVDFLICAKKYNQEKKFYEYIPLLAIEYDGPHHDEPDHKANDDIKDQLFRAFNLPLLRYPSTYPHKQIAQKVREFLL